MSITETRESERQQEVVVRVATDHLSMKQRALRGGATIVAGGLATLWALHGFPNPIEALKDFAHDVGEIAGNVWDEAGDVIGNGKEKADKAVNSMSGREAQALKVDPSDVIKGAVKGRTVMGMAEREITVKHASKKYNSPIPFNDEFINIDNGVFVGKAYVPGNVEITGTSQDITISLPQALRVSDTTIRKEPHIGDDADLGPQVGQVPGAETSSDQARRELDAYVQSVIASDKELPLAASCWGIESAKGLLAPALSLAGFEPLSGTDTGVDGNPGNDVRLHFRARIGTYQNGYAKQGIFINESDCNDVLDGQIPALQDETFVLPAQVIDDYRLKQEKK